MHGNQTWANHSHLGSIIITYNTTRSLVTGYLPYFLVFGQRPRLPASLLFQTARWQEMSQTVDEYVMSLYNTFTGQWWKLKNWWRSELHAVVEHVVDGIPMYVVKKNKTGTRKVLHWAHLLLWLAEEDGEPLKDHGTQLFAHAHTGAPPEEFQCQYYDPSKQGLFGSKFLVGGYDWGELRRDLHDSIMPATGCPSHS